MKKIFAILAVAMVAISANAQTEKSYTSMGILDNWYVGIGGGVGAKTTNTNMLKNLNALAGLKVGKWFTPSIGARIDADASFGNRPYGSNYATSNQVTSGSWGTVVRWTNIDLMGTLNLMNIFGGYKGEPRAFEIIAAPGIGWVHSFGTNKVQHPDIEGMKNMLTSKLALDLVYNLGEKKAWQVYLEPAITYALAGHTFDGEPIVRSCDEANFNIDRSFAQLTAGVVYKFKTANGTHNFGAPALRDQAEIDGLNNTINGLKGQLGDKDRKIADLQNQLAKKPKEIVRDQTNVISNAATNVFFALNSTVITDPKDKVNLDAVAESAKKNSDSRVVIMGAADSKTGNPTINQKLADGRAAAVKEYLIKKGVPADRISTNGVGGVDTLSPYPLNRRALVEVK